MVTLINLTLNFNIDFKTFRFYKEVYIFEMINYVCCYSTLLVCVNLFIYLNKSDTGNNSLPDSNNNVNNSSGVDSNKNKIENLVDASVVGGSGKD
jgi:hypothetical protein